MDGRFLEGIGSEVRDGGSGVLCVVVEQDGSTPRKSGAAMWVRRDGSISGTIGGGPVEHECISAALAMLEGGDCVQVREWNLAAGLTGKCPEGAVCGGRTRIYMEAISPSEEIVVIGAGHVGKALARIASAAGYRVTVWDERPEFANRENIPWCETVCCSLEEFFSPGGPGEPHLHEGSCVVIVTRGHSLDSEAMRLMERRKAAYIGVIGSRSKIAFVDKKLRDAGVSQEHLSRVKRPIGLPIGAETPEEIAVAILAEIVAAIRGADLEKLRAR